MKPKIYYAYSHTNAEKFYSDYWQRWFEKNFEVVIGPDLDTKIIREFRYTVESQIVQAGYCDLIVASAGPAAYNRPLFDLYVKSQEPITPIPMAILSTGLSGDVLSSYMPNVIYVKNMVGMMNWIATRVSTAQKG